MGMGFQEVVNGLSDKAEVAVCDHLEWVFADDTNEFLHLLENSIMPEIFKVKNIFVLGVFQQTRNRT